MKQPPKDLNTFSALLTIVEALRGPEGCPWDKEQTHRSLTPFAIEEAHELAEAIEHGTTQDMVGELGDLLLQVVLHAEIGRQEGTFKIDDVIYSISEKMVRRHPHVFSTTTVKDSKDVLKNWAEIKDQEKKDAGRAPSKAERFDIPLSMPALTRSNKIGEKTKKAKFDWEKAEEVLEKVREEVAELEAEIHRAQRDPHAIEHELGDVFFSVAQLARHLGVEPEQSLRVANARFEKRFFKTLSLAQERSLNWDQLSTAEKESLWQSVKKLE